VNVHRSITETVFDVGFERKGTLEEFAGDCTDDVA